MKISPIWAEMSIVLEPMCLWSREPLSCPRLMGTALGMPSHGGLVFLPSLLLEDLAWVWTWISLPQHLGIGTGLPVAFMLAAPVQHSGDTVLGDKQARGIGAGKVRMQQTPQSTSPWPAPPVVCKPLVS